MGSGTPCTLFVCAYVYVCVGMHAPMYIVTLAIGCVLLGCLLHVGRNESKYMYIECVCLVRQ